MKKRSLTLITACLLFFGNNAYGQWSQTGGPVEGGPVNRLAVSGNTIIAGADMGGIYKSTNNGESWTAANAGIAMNTRVFDLIANGNTVFAGTDNGVYKSTDSGKSWTEVTTGLPEYAMVFAVAANGDVICAVSDNGVALSTNNGESWDTAGYDLTDIICCVLSGGNIIVGFEGAVGFSNDKGVSWTYTGNGDDSTGMGYVYSLAVSGNTVFAGTDNGVFFSTDNGVSWTAANTGLADRFVTDLLITDDTIFASTGGGVFLSTNKGASWTATVNNGIENEIINALARSGHMLFAATESGIFRSTNNGASWTAVNAGIAHTGVYTLAVSGDALFANGDGLYRSMDDGTTWTAINDGNLTDDHDISCFAVSGGRNVFAGTEYYSGGIGPTLHNGVFRSTDNGASWTRVNTGLTDSSIIALAACGDTIFAGSKSGCVFRSTNNGTSWTSIGCPGSSMMTLAVNNGRLFAGVFGNGVYVSVNNGESWNEAGSGISGDNVLAVNGDNIFAGSGSYYAFSADNGASWTKYSVSFNGKCFSPWVNTAVFNAGGDKIFTGGDLDGISLSTDNGKSWTTVNDGLTGAYMLIHSLVLKGDMLFAGTSENGVLRRPISEMISVPAEKQINGPVQTKIRISVSASAYSGLTINYTIPSRCFVQLELYTISGQRVALRKPGMQTPGEYRVRFANGDIPAGVYAYRFQAGNYRASDLVKVMK